MANYGGPHWVLPQDAALQAQQAYQRQAAAVVHPPASTDGFPLAVTPATAAVAPVGLDTVQKKNRLSRMEDRVLVTRTADEETEDGRICNKEAMAKIRDAWVYKQIRERVDEFTEYKQVMNMFCRRLICFLSLSSQIMRGLGPLVLWNMECKR